MILLWLQRTLLKLHKEKDISWYVEQLDENLSWVDPTPGTYTQWILYQLILNRLLPEDYEKTNELLKQFHRIKRRMPIELRDIRTYKNFSVLYKATHEYLPKTRSKKELQLDGTETIFKNSEYALIKLTTVESVVSVSKNTGWCTCNSSVAKNYLKQCPIYIMYRKDVLGFKKFLLIHQKTNQVMLEDNEPYLEYEPHLMEIFKKYLPDLYCPKHSPNGELRNKPCASECGNAGCCDTFISCKGCSNKICDACVRDCITCELGLCEDCIAEECYNADCGMVRDGVRVGYLCHEHINLCENCEIPMCVDHQEECNYCGLKYCGSCSYLCVQCSSFACSNHYFECQGCLEEVCRKCQNAGVFCVDCDKEFCEECLNGCTTCKKMVCEECSYDGLCDGCETGRDEGEEDEYEEGGFGLARYY